MVLSNVECVPGSHRTQHARRSQAEDRILEAAVVIVCRRGLAAVTLAEVGEQAGFSRALPAHYFGNKAGLEAALARHIVSRFRRGLSFGKKPKRGLDAVLVRVEAYLESAIRDPDAARAMQMLIADAILPDAGDQADAIIAITESSVEFFSDQIRIGIAQGEIRSDIDPQSHARFILSALRGLVGQYLLVGLSLDLRGLGQEMISSLRRGMSS